MMQIRYALMAAAIVGVGFSYASDAALIPNGNFASPAQGAGGYVSFGGGDSTDIPNFTTTGPVQVLSTSYSGNNGFPVVPTTGDQLLELFNDSGAGGIETSLTLPAGETDTISFYVGGRSTVGNAAVFFGGTPEGTFSSAGNGAFQQSSFTVVGTGLPEILLFTDANTTDRGGTGTVLQEVAATPEPATLGLLAVTTLGILGRRRRV